MSTTTFDEFLVFFMVFQIIYMVLVVLLIVNYTKREPFIWIILLSSVYTAIVLVVKIILDDIVKKGAHLNFFKSIRPTVDVLEVLHIFLLGLCWEKYYTKGAAFCAFFPILLVLKMAEIAFYDYVIHDYDGDKATEKDPHMIR